jgi:hypothetical protein
MSMLKYLLAAGISGPLVVTVACASAPVVLKLEHQKQGINLCVLQARR